jgi:hypothetical protein
VEVLVVPSCPLAGDGFTKQNMAVGENVANKKISSKRLANGAIVQHLGEEKDDGDGNV